MTEAKTTTLVLFQFFFVIFILLLLPALCNIVKTPLDSNSSLLINRLMEGEETAYAHVVEHYHHQLCVYAASLTKDRDVAEDLVQNVFIKLWKRRERLNVKVSLTSMLYKAVFNEFVDFYRNRTTVMKAEERYYEHLDAIVREYDDTSIETAIKMVFEAIETLPERCREIFILSKKDGLTNTEIAGHLGISVKTVEGQISKAFKFLRDTLGEQIKPILFLLFPYRRDIEA